MIHSISEFETLWLRESAATQKILNQLTDSSLDCLVVPGNRTLGRLAWHIVTTIPEMMSRTGLDFKGFQHTDPVPRHAEEISRAYQQVAGTLLKQIREKWTDSTLAVVDEMYGERWRRGESLTGLILHEIHHRGQMTVLMRQAGLKVPGVYGPALEEWADYGMQPPAV
jgi:uncharacterized damage-inducible protein DinB